MKKFLVKLGYRYYKTKLKVVKWLKRQGLISVHTADRWSCKTVVDYNRMIGFIV